MWSQLSLVTDAEIGQVEPEATASGAPWGATTWASARTEAKRDLKIMIERDYASQGGPGVVDRILDRWAPDWVFAYTGGTYTDVTSAARDDNESDINVAAALATVGTDRIYVGAAWEFEGLAVTLLSTLNAIASTLTVKYWGPAGWTALGATDGTAASGATFGQGGRITWTLPTDWTRKRLNGTADEYFWVEISISVALTSGVVATQLVPIRAPDGLKRVACYLALGHIFRGLAAASGEPESWLGRVTNEARAGYRDMGEDLYASLRDGGGIPLDLNRNDVIEPGEAQVSAPLRLRRG